MPLTIRRASTYPQWVWLPILALLPLLFYSIIGYGGHDYRFHVTSWIELHNAWKAHEWTLGWSQWAQYGFGEPRFCFYPPISLLIGAALTFLMPLRFVPAAAVWLVLSLSGLSMYLAAGRLLPREHRLSAAILYMFNPYLVLTIVERFAIAEAWVQALLPLTFLVFYIAAAEYRLRFSALLALLLAIGWLTNIPEAIAFFYAFGLLAVVLAIHGRTLRPLVVIAASQAGALALAAFRLVPTFQEKGWIAADALLLYDLRANMLFTRFRPFLIVLLCGLFAFTGLAIAFVAARQRIRTERAPSALMLCLLTLVCFAVLVQLPVSTPLWNKLPEFRFVLFPFRFLPLLSLATVLLLFSGAISKRLRRAGIVFLLVQALFPFGAFTRLFDYQRFPSFDFAVSQWQKGFEGLREYVPVGVPHSRALPKKEMALQSQGPFAYPACQPALLATWPNEKLLSTSSPVACTLTLNTFYYPFWTAALDGNSPLRVGMNPDGLLAVNVPAGLHRIRLFFAPATRMRAVSGMVSFLALLLVLVSTVFQQRRPRLPIQSAEEVEGQKRQSSF